MRWNFLGVALLIGLLFPPAPARAGDPDLRVSARAANGVLAAAWPSIVNKDGLLVIPQGPGQDFALATLDHYILTCDPTNGDQAEGRRQMATWINLYHALLIREILRHPGLASPKSDPGFFTERRFKRLDGTPYSLEDLSEKNIVPVLGWRARGILHLGSYGGPPLPAQPLDEDTLDKQIDANWRKWLGSPDHFRAMPDRIHLSPMFLWHREEFEIDGGFRKVLPRYLPADAGALVQRKDLRVEYLPFDWTLSAAGNPPHTYTLGRMLRDRWWPW